VDAENNLRLNRELFSLELKNLGDLSRFLNWEISHLQTVSDLASQLRRLITVQEFKPMGEVRRALEQMLTPQQVLQSQTVSSLDQLADIVKFNFHEYRNELDAITEAKMRNKLEYEQRIAMLTRENQTLAQSYKEAQRKQQQSNDLHGQAEMTREALAKMEQLVKLNDDLMQSNGAL